VRSTVSQVTPFPFFNMPASPAMKAMKASKKAKKGAAASPAMKAMKAAKKAKKGGAAPAPAMKAMKAMNHSDSQTRRLILRRRVATSENKGPSLCGPEGPQATESWRG